MALAGVTDIVMDVARAADPKAVENARLRLEAIAKARSPREIFEAAGTAAAARAAPPRQTPEHLVKFEAMVLQTFLQSMLPEESEAVYGSGIAGEMWRSLLAQELAGEMAKAGGVGIADRVLGDYYRDGRTIVPVAGATPEPARAEAGEKALLSAALVQEMQRAVARALDEDRAAQTRRGT